MFFQYTQMAEKKIETRTKKLSLHEQLEKIIENLLGDPHKKTSNPNTSKDLDEILLKKKKGNFLEFLLRIHKKLLQKETKLWNATEAMKEYLKPAHSFNLLNDLEAKMNRCIANRKRVFHIITLLNERKNNLEKKYKYLETKFSTLLKKNLSLLNSVRQSKSFSKNGKQGYTSLKKF